MRNLLKWLPGYRLGYKAADSVWQKKWDEASRIWTEQKAEEEDRVTRAYTNGQNDGRRWGQKDGESLGRMLERKRWLFERPTLTVSTLKQCELAQPIQFDGYRSMNMEHLLVQVAVDGGRLGMCRNDHEYGEKYFQAEMTRSLAKALVESNAIRLGSDWDVCRQAMIYHASLFVAIDKNQKGY